MRIAQQVAAVQQVLLRLVACGLCGHAGRRCRVALQAAVCHLCRQRIARCLGRVQLLAALLQSSGHCDNLLAQRCTVSLDLCKLALRQGSCLGLGLQLPGEVGLSAAAHVACRLQLIGKGLSAHAQRLVVHAQCLVVHAQDIQLSVGTVRCVLRQLALLLFGRLALLPWQLHGLFSVVVRWYQQRKACLAFAQQHHPRLWAGRWYPGAEMERKNNKQKHGKEMEEDRGGWGEKGGR
eukprot:356071-Chlamydomonas_euryale.AAC.3